MRRFVLLTLFVMWLAACVPIDPASPPPDLTPEITPDLTPTLELFCVKGSYTETASGTVLYETPALVKPVAILSGVVLFTSDRTENAVRVVTADGALIEGWLPIWLIPEPCR